MHPPVSSTFSRGFSLVELIIASAILVVLAGIVFAALNPAEQFREARNSTRRNDVDALSLASALYQSKGGKLPGVDGDWRMLGTATTGCRRRCGDLNHASQGFAFKSSPTGWTNLVYFAAPTGNTPALNLPRTGTRTFSAWFRLNDDEDSWSGILSKYGGGNGYGVAVGWSPFYDDGTGTMRLLDPTADSALIAQIKAAGKANAMVVAMQGAQLYFLSTTNYPVKAGQYQHIAVTYDGTLAAPKFSIYVDGERQPTAEGIVPLSALTDFSGSSASFAVGVVTLLLFNIDFNGKIDEVSVYNRVLSDNEIAQLSDGDDVSSGLSAQWRFDEGAGRYAGASNSSANYQLQLQGTMPPGYSYDDFWSDDEPLLPSSCIDLSAQLVVNRLPRMPVAPAVSGGRFTPDDQHTFYAIRQSGAIIVRSCMVEQEDEDGVVSIPVIEKNR